MRFVVLTGVLLGVCATVYASGGALWSWLEKQVSTTIKVTGSKRMSYHIHDVSGDRNSFNEQNYFGDGDQRYTDYTDLFIRGEKFLKYFNFETRLTNNRFGNPQDRRFTLVYDSKLFSTQLGDISAALHNTNPLLQFTKSMSGVMGTLRFGKGYEMKMLGSDTKASARTIAIPGNNSMGPYYLPGGNIVDGTLQIRIQGMGDDNKVLQLGEDYTVDYQTGLLNFMKITVPATASIQATYESYGFNNDVGSIFGASMLLPFVKHLTFELTAVEQKSKGQSGLMTRIERFWGYGPASTPYDLQYEPLIDPAHPFTIQMLPDQRYLVLGVDFYFDKLLPFRFYMFYDVPPEKQLVVTYTPKPTTNSITDGNKKIYGLAMHADLFKGATLQYSMGNSTLESPGGGMKGRAQQVGLNYQVGKMTFKASFDDIPDTYASISSTGFQRNERGQQYNFGYNIGLGWTLRAGWTKSTVSSPIYGANGQVTENPADSTSQNFTLDWNGKNSGHFTLTHLTNLFGSASGDSSRTMDTARYSRKFGNFTTGIELSDSRIGFTQTSTGSPNNSTYNSVRLDETWQASKTLAFTGGVGQNRVSGTGGSSNGRDMSLTMAATPNDKFNFHLTLTDSTSGLYNYNGYGSGDNYGYGNGGFSGGGNNNSPYVGSTTRGYSATVHYQANSKLSFDVSDSRQLATGDYQSNSDTHSTSLTAGFSPKSWLRVNGMVSLQKSSFTANASSSNTTMYTLGISAGPVRRWSLSLDVQKMGSGSLVTNPDTGLTNYTQNTDSYFFRVFYDLGHRQRLFFDSQSGSSGGYLASTSTNSGLGYEYQLTKFLSLVGAYRVRNQNNLDTSSSAYSYRSRSFDVDLAFNF